MGHSSIPSWVYPRVCGGTDYAPHQPFLNGGLSPRVRGNPGKSQSEIAAMRSIPACAGEPLSQLPVAGGYRVYPRVCGGT